jgi:hypothetical protein
MGTLKIKALQHTGMNSEASRDTTECIMPTISDIPQKVNIFRGLKNICTQTGDMD